MNRRVNFQLNEMQLAEIEQAINRLRLYLAEQTNVLLSYTRFRALLAKLDSRWKQSKHDLGHLQDPSAQDTMRELLDWLKKTSPSTPAPKPSSSLWTKRP